MPSSYASDYSDFWARRSSLRQSPRAYNRPYPEPRGGNIPPPSFLPRSPRLSSPERSEPLVFNDCIKCAFEHKKLEDEKKKVMDLDSENLKLFWENQGLKEECSRQAQEIAELDGYLSALSYGERELVQHARSATDEAYRRADIDRKKVDRLRERIDYHDRCHSKAYTELCSKMEQLQASSAAEIEEQREVNRAEALRFRAVEASKDEQLRSLEAELAEAKQDCARVTAQHNDRNQCAMILIDRLRELQPPTTTTTTNGSFHTTAPSSKHNDDDDDVAEAEAKVRHLVGNLDGDAQQRAAAVTILHHRIETLDAELRAASAKLDELNQFELGPCSPARFPH